MAIMPKKQLTYFKTMRLRTGLMQSDVAALVGTSAAQISRIECDRCVPTTKQLLALSFIYDKKCVELMAGYAERLAACVQRSARLRKTHVCRDVTAKRSLLRTQTMAAIGRRLRNNLP